MFELIVALCLMVVGAVVLKKINDRRLEARQNMLRAMDDMFRHWSVLMDAKQAYDADVSDEIMNLATFMVKSARLRFIEYMLASALASYERPSSDLKGSLTATLRDPLADEFQNLVHAWFRCVANKNLFMRPFIALAIGRKTVGVVGFKPFNAQVVKKVANQNDPCEPGGLAA